MHPKQEILEEKMAQLCQALDNYLEDIFGDHYRIHPNRLRRGKGSNPSFDGLFSTSLAFTLGYGSQYGRGYVVNVDEGCENDDVSGEEQVLLHVRMLLSNMLFLGSNAVHYLEITKD